MKNIVSGDTVYYRKHLETPDGTDITTGSTTLDVYDSKGSQVVAAAVATHVATGTWKSDLSSVGYGTGLVKQIWKTKSTLGTFTDIVGNEFKVVGSLVEQDTYVLLYELKHHYDDIEQYFDGSEEEKLFLAKEFIDRRLESMGYKLPAPKGSDGRYDQPLRDWQANQAVYRIISSFESSRTTADENGYRWFDFFKKEAEGIEKGYATKRFNFTNQVSPGESGVGPGTKLVGTSPGDMETNWQGYGSGFQGADYPRTWFVEITGTGTAQGLKECNYKWSWDNGISYGTGGTTGADWIHLSDQVYIRFTQGTETGTENLFNIGDKWRFKTHPRKHSVGGKNIAWSY